MFAKRHYEFLAAWLKEEISYSPEYQITKSMVHTLANKLAYGDPRFDRTRFLSACGIPEDEQWPR